MTDENDSQVEALPGGIVYETVAGLTTGLIGYRLGGLDGALISNSATPYVAYHFKLAARELFGDRVGRAEEALRSAGEELGLDPEELADRGRQSPRTRFLTDAAIQAAADTLWPHGVRALGRALAHGLVQSDDDVIDIPKMMLPAMTSMGFPHLKVLELLVMCRWDRALTTQGERGLVRIDAPETNHFAHIPSEWTSLQMTSAAPSLEPVLASVIGTLERYGLIGRNDPTAKALTKFSEALDARQDGSGRGNVGQVSRISSITFEQQIVPEPSWSPTALGEQVLGYYDLIAFSSEYTSSPPGQGT